MCYCYPHHILTSFEIYLTNCLIFSTAVIIVNVSSVSVRRSAGMLKLETPALESRSIYGGQFTIVNSATQHYSFFRNLAP